MILENKYFLGLKCLHTSIFIMIKSYYNLSAIFITIIVTLIYSNKFYSYWLTLDHFISRQPAIVLVPPSQALKNLTSSLWQTESPDNPIILHMFNNNTYTDFRTVNKHPLILSYVIWIIQQNQNVTKLICAKYDRENKPVKKSSIFSFFYLWNTFNITSSIIF